MGDDPTTRQNPPEIAYRTRGEWCLAGDARL